MAFKSQEFKKDKFKIYKVWEHYWENWQRGEKEIKIPCHLTVKRDALKSAVNLVQTSRQQVTQEVREGLSPAGEKGGKVLDGRM
jgi:deoxyribodipyrimidine photolyase